MDGRQTIEAERQTVQRQVQHAIEAIGEETAIKIQRLIRDQENRMHSLLAYQIRRLQELDDFLCQHYPASTCAADYDLTRLYTSSSNTEEAL